MKLRHGPPRRPRGRPRRLWVEPAEPFPSTIAEGEGERFWWTGLPLENRKAADGRRGPGRPRSPAHQPDLVIKNAACQDVRRLLEQDEDGPDLWEYVQDWLTETRLSADSVWEEELHEDDWAKVAGPEPDFWRNTPARRILLKLIRKRLEPEKKLDTVLRAVAHWYGLDTDKLKSHDSKGASTERRRKKRGE